MNNKLWMGFALGWLVMLIGLADITLFWTKGIMILHPFSGLMLVLSGFFLSAAVLVSALEIRRPEKKIEKQKPYEKDGWESCGCGMYILTSAKIARDEEIKRKADFEAYMAENSPNKKEKK